MGFLNILLRQRAKTKTSLKDKIGAPDTASLVHKTAMTSDGLAHTPYKLLHVHGENTEQATRGNSTACDPSRPTTLVAAPIPPRTVRRKPAPPFLEPIPTMDYDIPLDIAPQQLAASMVQVQERSISPISDSLNAALLLISSAAHAVRLSRGRAPISSSSAQPALSSSYISEKEQSLQGVSSAAEHAAHVTAFDWEDDGMEIDSPAGHTASAFAPYSPALPTPPATPRTPVMITIPVVASVNTEPPALRDSPAVLAPLNMVASPVDPAVSSSVPTAVVDHLAAQVPALAPTSHASHPSTPSSASPIAGTIPALLSGNAQVQRPKRARDDNVTGKTVEHGSSCHVEKKARPPPVNAAKQIADIVDALTDCRPFEKERAARTTIWPATQAPADTIIQNNAATGAGMNVDWLHPKSIVDGFTSTTLHAAPLVPTHRRERLCAPEPGDTCARCNHNIDVAARKLRGVEELEVSSPIDPSESGQRANLKSLRVLTFGERNGDMKATLDGLDMDNIRVVKGSDVSLSTVVYILNRSEGVAQVSVDYVRYSADVEDCGVRVSVQDNAGRVRIFDKCSTEMLGQLDLYHAESIVIDDRVKSPYLASLRRLQALDARELRIRVSGSADAPLWTYRDELFLMLGLERVVLVSSSKSTGRVPVMSANAHKLLGKIIVHPRVAQVSLERVRVPDWRNKKNMQALDKVGKWPKMA